MSKKYTQIDWFHVLTTQLSLNRIQRFFHEETRNTGLHVVVKTEYTNMHVTGHFSNEY